jgi:tartrate-resistant acid phosphatase type 5
MANWCRLRRCDFVVTLGDNFYDQGVQSIQDEHFQRSYLDVYQIDSLKGLKWYTILGNHDYRGNPDVQVEYTRYSPTWYLPSPYYSHDHKNNDVLVKFFMVDTNPMVERYYEHPKMNTTALKAQNVTQQLLWLNQEMNGVDGSKVWKIVIGHHPLYTNRFQSRIMVEDLSPIVKNNGAHCYFNGHDHNLQVFEEKILSITSGTGCSVRPVISHAKQTFVMEEMHFLYTTLEKDIMTVEVVGLDGQIYRTIQYGRNGPLKP